MSFIDHNGECGHPVIMHTPKENYGSACYCGCQGCEPRESVLIETFGLDHMRTPIVPPNDRTPVFGVPFTACGCESCRELFASLT